MSVVFRDPNLDTFPVYLRAEYYSAETLCIAVLYPFWAPSLQPLFASASDLNCALGSTRVDEPIDPVPNYAILATSPPWTGPAKRAAWINYPDGSKVCAIAVADNARQLKQAFALARALASWALKPSDTVLPKATRCTWAINDQFGLWLWDIRRTIRAAIDQQSYIEGDPDGPFHTMNSADWETCPCIQCRADRSGDAWWKCSAGYWF
jgi:hypothetical protein